MLHDRIALALQALEFGQLLHQFGRAHAQSALHLLAHILRFGCHIGQHDVVAALDDALGQQLRDRKSVVRERV